MVVDLKSYQNFTWFGWFTSSNIVAYVVYFLTLWLLMMLPLWVSSALGLKAICWFANGSCWITTGCGLGVFIFDLPLQILPDISWCIFPAVYIFFLNRLSLWIFLLKMGLRMILNNHIWNFLLCNWDNWGILVFVDSFGVRNISFLVFMHSSVVDKIWQ